eukprot:1157043-Pelagomonas_calceolata.AAC.1
MGGLELQRKSVMNVNGLLSKDTREDEDGNGNEEDSCSVCVAVKIRPLVTSEQEHGCRGTLAVAGGQQALPSELRHACSTGAQTEGKPDVAMVPGICLAAYNYMSGICDIVCTCTRDMSGIRGQVCMCI